MKRPSARAASRYFSFRGYPHKKTQSFSIKPIRELICLADAEYITYKSDKKNGGGDGHPQKFVHKFGANVKIYTNPEGDMLLIAGPKLRVTARGIVG